MANKILYELPVCKSEFSPGNSHFIVALPWLAATGQLTNNYDDMMCVCEFQICTFGKRKKEGAIQGGNHCQLYSQRLKTICGKH